MDLTPIVERLRLLLPELHEVSGAASVEAAMAGAANPPSAYVIPLRKQPQPNDLVNAHHQEVRWRFGVLLVVSAHARRVEGGADVEILHPVELAVCDALAGWSTGPEFDPIDEEPGRLVDLRNGRLWWLSEFSSMTFRRVT